MKNFLPSLTALILSISASAEIPEGAIPFILDSHVYIQATLCDTVPVSIIYDSGADRLYLDKDYMALSDLEKQPFRKGKARMGGAGNDGAQTIPIIIDEIPMTMGKVVHKEKITPIINLREIIGRWTDGMIGNNAVFNRSLIINYSGGYLLPVDDITPDMLKEYTKIPAQFNDNRIDIEGELRIDSVQTLKGTFRLDIGCGSTVILTHAALKKLNLEAKPKVRSYYSAYGVGGDGTDINFRADSFAFLDTLTNIVISASQNDRGALSERNHLGVFGNDIISHYDWIIDAPHNTIYAKRNGNLKDDYRHSTKTGLGYTDRTDICDGWIVSALYEKSKAKNAGFEIGDIILSVNDRPVKDISWEEQRNGLHLTGPTKYQVRKADGSIVTYTIDIKEEML